LSTLLDSAKLEAQQHLHRVGVLPIIVVYLNNICDSRCITCSIWKNNDLLRIPAARQMPKPLLQELYSSLGQWHPRQILLSGGEPVLHPQFPEAVHAFKGIASKVCVITNGLLLVSCDRAALENVAEFYISFDAPDRASYEKIRGVDGFDRLAASVDILNSLANRPKVVARCTLQHENVRRIPELIHSARRMGFHSISFLGADISSQAFARDVHGAADVAAIQPTRDDLISMEAGIQSLGNAADGFVEGGSEKLTRILQYFRALLGAADFPQVRCNAPWVSIVIETTGKIRGCFFQPIIGDFRSVNGEAAVRFRRSLNVNADPTCERCVCSKLLGTHDFLRM
jgi:MoaA/NifB/PqqE/SkfB family radical SAM enzyme